ncbi:MAG: imidazole glycerol phosphate synthase subunit HisH [Verrucomicrobiae bacterium]|nr:imidazole glycerol phosphate synthase subunit HisH [Verrucomicrobiae bacterium]
MKALVINVGMGNLGSVRRALEECGAEVRVSSRPEDLAWADRIILPGVGAFATGMQRLHQAGWVSALRQALANPRVRLLGICLGMQLLAGSGEEGGLTPGLGCIPGHVSRLQVQETRERLPHVGWNEVHPTRPHWLWDGIPDGTDFYFVHSYHLLPAQAGDTLATTPYAGGFVSVVGHGNILGVQFHPEKSGRPGFQLLRNFLAFPADHA